mgnify:CR=1 FL=1
MADQNMQIMFLSVFLFVSDCFLRAVLLLSYANECSYSPRLGRYCRVAPPPEAPRGARWPKRRLPSRFCARVGVTRVTNSPVDGSMAVV